jgi:hypothetical protein
MELCLQVLDRALRAIPGRYRRISRWSSIGKDCMNVINARGRLRLPFHAILDESARCSICHRKKDYLNGRLLLHNAHGQLIRNTR